VRRYGVPIIIAVIGVFVALAHLIMSVSGHYRPSVGLLAAAILLAAGAVWLGIELLHPKQDEEEI
jgi:hypothetical protein